MNPYVKKRPKMTALFLWTVKLAKSLGSASNLQTLDYYNINYSKPAVFSAAITFGCAASLSVVNGKRNTGSSIKPNL